MTRSIDLNSDLGEGFGPWAMGDDAKMLSLVTSANVACGGHASDPETMFKTLELARDRGVSVGAHPGFNDREGFGRRVIPMTPAEVTRMVAAQVGALQSLAALAGTTVDYVKAHGALANHAAAHREFADAVVAGIGMIHDAGEAAERLLQVLDTGLMPVVGGVPIPLAAHSICIHGDSPSAVAMAVEIRKRLLGLL